MANDLIYPLIDGVRYSWSSIIVNIGADQFLGCKSININEKVEPQKIHGTNQAMIGATAGQYDADGDCEFYQQEADAIVDALNARAANNVKGKGWMNAPLTVQVQYFDDGQPLRTKKLSVRFTSRTQGGSEGGEALTSKFTMFFLAPVIDSGTSGPPVVAVPPINAAAVVSGP
jgi:hypothetical protein